MKALGIIMVALLLGTYAFAAEPSTPIVGQYLEARSGHVHTCGCLYSGEQVTEGKEAILAWAFKGGEYGGTSLAGFNVVAVIVGEGHLGVESTRRSSALYVDSAGTEAQRQAAIELLHEQYGKALGTIIAVHQAPVVFEWNSDRLVVSLGGAGSVVGRKARLPEDAHPGSRTWYEPFIPMTDASLSTTLQYIYQGGDFSRQWDETEAGITGYMGSFALVR